MEFFVTTPLEVIKSNVPIQENCILLHSFKSSKKSLLARLETSCDPDILYKKNANSNLSMTDQNWSLSTSLLCAASESHANNTL